MPQGGTREFPRGVRAGCQELHDGCSGLSLTRPSARRRRECNDSYRSRAADACFGVNSGLSTLRIWILNSGCKSARTLLRCGPTFSSARRGLIRGRLRWRAPAVWVVRMHSGLGGHDAPPLRCDTIDSHALWCCSLGDSTGICAQHTRGGVSRGDTHREHRCSMGLDSRGSVSFTRAACCEPRGPIVSCVSFSARSGLVQCVRPRRAARSECRFVRNL
jgi:hypothetical protein